ARARGGRQRVHAPRHGSRRSHRRRSAAAPSPELPEQLPHLLEQPGLVGRVLVGHEAVEILEQQLLLAGELLGNFDLHEHVHVAAAAGIDAGRALAAQRRQLGAAGGTRRNGGDLVAPGRGNGETAAEGGLREGDGDGTEQLRALALEEGVGAHVDQHVEIAGRTTGRPGFAFTAKAKLHALLDAGGHADRALDLALDAALAPALGAGIADDHAGAAAGALAAAGVAFGEALELDLDLGALKRLLEGNFEVIAQVIAALGAAAGAAAAEQVPEAKELAEDVGKIGEVGGIEAAAVADARMAEAVVLGAFLLIGEDAVGLGGFLERFFRAGIALVAVGVVLERQAAVGALDVGVAGIAGNAEHFVIITLFGHVAELWELDSGRRLRGSLRDLDHGRADEAPMQLVAALQLLDDGALRDRLGGHHFDGFVQVRIEFLFGGLDRLQAHLAGGVGQLAVQQLDALAPVGGGILARHGHRIGVPQ